MAFKFDKRVKVRGNWKFQEPEPEAAHEDIPDLGIGVFEKRSENGALMVFFEGTHLTIKSAYVVIGKYKDEQARSDGRQYWVAEHYLGTTSPWLPNLTSYHEHLIMAIAKVAELHELFKKQRGLI